MRTGTPAAIGTRIKAAGALVALALAAGGCQTVTVSDLNPFGDSTAPQGCPRAATLADAVSITEFGRGAERDDNNIIHSARIERTHFECTVTAGQVVGRVIVVGTLTLGRKGKAGDITLPIFVALTRNGSDVISKRFEEVKVTVESGASTAPFETQIADYTFNLGGGESTAAYEILTGFNLTPEQIAYNRKQLGG